MGHWCSSLIKPLKWMKEKGEKLLNISLKLKRKKGKRKKCNIHQVWINTRFYKLPRKNNLCLKKIVKSWMIMKFLMKLRQLTIHSFKSTSWKWHLIRVNMVLEFIKLKRKSNSWLYLYFHLKKFFTNFVFLWPD